jgi:hypothetical protein
VQNEGSMPGLSLAFSSFAGSSEESVLFSKSSFSVLVIALQGLLSFPLSHFPLCNSGYLLST